MNRTSLLAATALAALPLAAAAQERPVAIQNVRILTLEGAPIERGTVVLRGGKIEAVGREVTVPAGARIEDGKGGTVMPGLVSAWFRIEQAGPRTQELPGRGGRRGPRGPMPTPGPSATPVNLAASKAAASLYANQEVFADLLGLGVTTLGYAPSGQGFPGRGAVLNPAGRTAAALTVDDAAFVLVAPAANTRAKELLKGELDKAAKVLAARKAPPPASQPATAPGSQPAGAPASQPAAPAAPPAQAPQGRPGPAPAGTPGAPQGGSQPQPQKDPNVEVLADLLDGKARAFLEVGSANDLIHYLDAVGSVRFPTVVIAARGGGSEGRLDEVLDQVKELKAPVLLPTALPTAPFTRDLVNQARRLHDAGIEVGFHLGNSKEGVRQLFFRLMELVRCGLPAEAALRGVTLAPAKMLGLDRSLGSLKVGKDADLLLFSGDPLDPASRLVKVWHKGQEVKKDPTR
ncbi:MAG: amidohydrolase family protein [Planctomycetes bacterium]|nr:amidohydrolase family protein [Planctomycetota bacterium]